MLTLLRRFPSPLGRLGQQLRQPGNEMLRRYVMLSRKRNSLPALRKPSQSIAPQQSRQYALIRQIEFNQTELAKHHNEKHGANIPLDGCCLSLTAKASAIDCLGVKHTLDANIEKAMAKQYGYQYEVAKRRRRAATLPASDNYGNADDENIAIARAFVCSRVSKVTDTDKNIYLNSMEVGFPIGLSIEAYLKRHGLHEGQSLIGVFTNPWVGGHAVKLTKKLDGEVIFFDPNGGFWKCDQTDPKLIAKDVQEKLRQGYSWYGGFMRGLLTTKEVIPVTAVPEHERLPSQIIKKSERDKIDKKIGPAWDPETETPVKETEMTTLVVERDPTTQALLWAALDMPNGKILKLGGEEIPKNIHEEIQVDRKVSITPIPRARVLRERERTALPPELRDADVETQRPKEPVRLQTLLVNQHLTTEALRSAVFLMENGELLRLTSAEMPQEIQSEIKQGHALTFKPIAPVEETLGALLTISIPIENSLALFKARTLSKSEEKEVRAAMQERWKGETTLPPMVEGQFKVLLETRNDEKELESAVFKIVGMRDVFKLIAEEIPENMKEAIKKGETVCFAPIPNVFERSLSKAKRMKR